MIANGVHAPRFRVTQPMRLFISVSKVQDRAASVAKYDVA